MRKLMYKAPLPVHDMAENSLSPVEFTKIHGDGKTVF